MMKSDCLDRVNNEGLILFGCGKMGSALLSGWLANGVKHDAVSVIDPRPSKWLKGLEEKGVTLNGGLTDAAACILAVKPQMLSEAGLLDEARDKSPLFISIAAGTTLASLSAILGYNVSIVRSMPNTPALIGQGVSALIGNNVCRKQDMDLAVALLETVGQVITINDEKQMDVVTGISGSGPAYVFHFIECLATAGEAHGLDADVAMQLAKATIRRYRQSPCRETHSSRSDGV